MERNRFYNRMSGGQRIAQFFDSVREKQTYPNLYKHRMCVIYKEKYLETAWILFWHAFVMADHTKWTSPQYCM